MIDWFSEVREKMKIGYARVSTDDQKLDAQIDALKKDGCEKIYEEKRSGTKNRPILEECLNDLRSGDTLVVTKLDRLGRTLKQLVELIEEFKERGIHFRCLTDPIDTTSASGEFFFHIMGAFSELERNLIRERTAVGLRAARSRGKTGGRPETISTDKKELAYQLYMENKRPLKEISESIGISRMTIYRYIEKRERENAAAKSI